MKISKNEQNYYFGFYSEDIATNFLKNQGYVICKRNFRSKYGEIDIIAKKNGVFHFFEVKSTSKDYDVEYKITKSKLTKIIKTVNVFLALNNEVGNFQIDAIFIKNGEINLIQNITF